MHLQPCCLQAVAFYMITHPAGSSKPMARSVARAAEASEQYGVEAAVDEVAPLSAAEGQQLREGVLHDLLEVSHQSLHQDRAVCCLRACQPWLHGIGQLPSSCAFRVLKAGHSHLCRKLIAAAAHAKPEAADTLRGT